MGGLLFTCLRESADKDNAKKTSSKTNASIFSAGDYNRLSNINLRVKKVKA